MKLLGLFLVCASLFAQDAMHEAFVKHWKTSGEFTLAVANAMPADDYGFKPVPQEMSFGQLIDHIAAAQLGACGIASGMPRPAIPDAIAASIKDQKAPVPDKESIVSFLRDTFSFCDKAVESMTPDKLDAVVGPASRKMTGFEWLWAYFTHTAHHRGQAEVYLRLKGITPPEYAF